MKEKITQAKLKELLSYDPETGDFTWLAGCKMAGKKASHINKQGYVAVNINNGNICHAHRLAWIYVYGKNPNGQIDHINGIRNDNRIVNLRECSKTQNSWNTGITIVNKSGFKGVSWHKKAGKWQAHININGKGKYLGIFACVELASAAYQLEAKAAHGEFYRETPNAHNLRLNQK